MNTKAKPAAATVQLPLSAIPEKMVAITRNGIRVETHAAGRGPKIVDASGQEIARLAHLGPYDGRCETAEGMSRLFAAAPDLLEACKAMRQGLVEIRYAEWPVKGLGIDCTPEALDELINSADAAIAKAEGSADA